MSPQVRPFFVSTSSGAASSMAEGIVSSTIDSSWSISSRGASNISSSCTWMIIIVRIFRSSSLAWSRTIAILMMSAAVPWMGMLIAIRSPAARTWKLRDCISGM